MNEGKIFGWHSPRNTECYGVGINGVELYFSYKTLIGVFGKDGARRRENIWGPTTGRHIRELHLENVPVMEEAELYQYAMDSIYEKMLEQMRVFEDVLTS